MSNGDTERNVKIVAGLVAAVVFALIPIFIPSYYLELLESIFVCVILATSWNLVSGYGGQVLFGIHGIFGMGGYTVGIIFKWIGVSPLFLAPLTSLGVATIVVLVLYNTFKLRGAYFAITTLVLAEVARRLVIGFKGITGGGSGFTFPTINGGYPSPIQFYYATLIVLAACFLTYYLFLNSSYGLRLQTIREDEDAAMACGVNSPRYKAMTFFISSFFISWAASYYAYSLTSIYPPTIFNVETFTIIPILATMLGGIGTIFGPIVGTPIVIYLQRFFAGFMPQLGLIVLMAILIAIMIFARGGIVSLAERIWAKIRK